MNTYDGFYQIRTYDCRGLAEVFFEIYHLI
jgi:hypothetical protein